MMLGSNVLSKVIGYDKELDCTVVTRDNLTPHVPASVQFEIRHGDSQSLSELDGEYRLVHIDADKSYEGTYHDLELTFKKARVVLVGDIGLDSDERSAIIFRLKGPRGFCRNVDSVFNDFTFDASCHTQKLLLYMLLSFLKGLFKGFLSSLEAF